jgi:hypothetical protein
MIGKLFRILLYLFLTSIVGTILFILIFFLACYLVPPNMRAANGIIYPTMPIGQSLIAGFFSILFGIWFFLLMLSDKIKLLT